MAKRKKLSAYERRKNVERIKKKAAAGKKAAIKLKGRKQSRETRIKLKRYRMLVKAYVRKQQSEGRKITYRQAEGSKAMKQILHDIKRPENAFKLRALKQTDLRDGIPDSIPVGESYKLQGEAA